MIDVKYKCECGYEGPAKWLTEVTEADDGHWEREYRGCPRCKKTTNEMEAIGIIKGDDE